MREGTSHKLPDEVSYNTNESSIRPHRQDFMYNPPSSSQSRDAAQIVSDSEIQEKQNHLDDLRKVGKEKPLGYLPIDTITKICNETIENIAKEAKIKGLSLKRFRREQTKSGVLYVYDKKSLGELLQKNSSTLQEAGWPTDPSAFVWKVSSTTAPNKTKLFDVIADAFADYTNQGRTDVS
jgi:hypothetical protein